MLGLGESPEENPLSSLLRTRWVESGALLVAGLLPSLADCSDGPRGDTMKSPDPRTSQLVREWRDSVRVWSCHLYSYAVPSEPALLRLAAEAPLLEIGAGTGYWAYLLRRRSVVVHAYDIRLARDDNDYHGHSPAWTRVERGGPEAAANHAGSALFLCYPPPGNMALQVLNFFPGNRVLLVGEWSGDTASQKFQEKLMQTFELVDTVPLPNWADTAAALSVWQRRPRPLKHVPPEASPLRCWHCGAAEGLKRCRLSYEATFCSKACASKKQTSTRHRANLTDRKSVV